MSVEETVRDELRDVYDPEIPVNIVDLGLIYEITIEENNHAHVEMTLTSMGCPIADQIKRNVELAATTVDEIESANAELVWDPPWEPAKATQRGKDKLRSLGISIPDNETGSGESDTPPGYKSPGANQQSTSPF